MAKKFDRDQFFRKTSSLDREDLENVLWTLYWRGDARVRERVEGLIDPSQITVTAPAPPAAEHVRKRVREFAALARAGAYLAGDRRVSPKERTRWRFTYKDHFVQSLAAVSAGGGDEVRPAVEAVATLINLTCEMDGLDYFRSDDPVEASKVVISEVVDRLWAGIGRALGTEELCRLAAAQTLRWERESGWTRRGQGRTAEAETTLTEVLSRHLCTPDMWWSFSEHYLLELGTTAGKRASAGYDSASSTTRSLDALNRTLIDRLQGSEFEDRIGELLENRGLNPSGRKRLREYCRGLTAGQI